METSLQILMEGLIDYAGLFPPASLDMDAAVRNYASYARSPQAAWLGRFVLPVSRLGEFSATAAALPAPDSREREWRLSALAGSDLTRDLAAIGAFNRNASTARAGEIGAQKAVVDVLEMKADGAEAIQAAMEEIPSSLTPYFEIPIQDDPAPLIAAIARAGGRAKVRTGGVTPAVFPSPCALARFISACARAGVPFKATAGLHHPVRSARRLTYEPDSAETIMHGFLNVFLASAFAAKGMDAETVNALLQEESPGAFAFRGEEVAWRGHRIDASQLRTSRRNFSIAFGSCSFDEPKTDLLEAGLL
ncbi:MAG: hypothetical protein JWO30_1525 [Fibrobacteres bacterium]|nr:hypothetical protein [Fibrobacterota bacterium]